MDWSKLDEYASILHSQDAYRVKAHGEEVKRKLREDLDQQVADTRLRNQRRRDQDLQFFQEQMEQTEKWKEAEEKKETSRREKQADERAKREEMLADTARRKAEEKEQKVAEDRQMLAKIAKELDKERNVIIVRKAQAQANHKKKEEERIKDQILKDELKQKQLEEDLRMMREYQEMMMQQELKRQADLDFRKKRQQQNEERMSMTTTAVAETFQAAEDKVARERAEIAARALEMDRKKAEKHKNLTDETQAFIFKQMEEKADKARRTREQKLEAAQLLQMDTKDYHDAEKQKADERRARNVAHREELERQIALRNRPFPGVGVGKKSADSEYIMSETEMKMNRRLIKQVKSTLAETAAANMTSTSLF